MRDKKDERLIPVAELKPGLYVMIPDYPTGPGFHRIEKAEPGVPRKGYVRLTFADKVTVDLNAGSGYVSIVRDTPPAATD